MKDISTQNQEQLKRELVISLILVFSFLIVQQILSASTNIFALELAKNLHTSANLSYFVLYLCSFFAPYTVAIFGVYFAKKIEHQLCNINVHKVTDAFSKRIHQALDSETAKTANSGLGAEVPKHTQALVSNGYHLASAGLNILFNGLTIALAMDSRFLLSIMIGLLFSSVWIKISSKWVTMAAQELQDKSLSHASQLSRSFSNFASQNELNIGIWLSRYKSTYSQLLAWSLKSEKINQGVAILAAFLFAMPAAALSVILFIEYSADSERQMTLSLIMPRLFLIMNSAHFFIMSAVDSSASKKIYDRSIEVLTNDSPDFQSDPTNTQSILSGRVKKSLLTFQSTKGGDLSYEQFFSKLKARLSRDRLTIRGPNGSGKSTTLLKIKKLLGSQAVLMSPALNLDFESEIAGSSAQKTLAHLKEIIEKSEAEFLLLDEWDAHLDANWMAEISRELDIISKAKTIIEVRHRE